MDLGGSEHIKISFDESDIFSDKDTAWIAGCILIEKTKVA